MQAIILAAGMGNRLKDYTNNKPKCMVEVNKVSIIDRLLKQLETLDLERIILVVVYGKNKLIKP